MTLLNPPPFLRCCRLTEGVSGEEDLVIAPALGQACREKNGQRHTLVAVGKER
jgi:hypothetical protein